MTLRPDSMMPCKSMSHWWAVWRSNAGTRRGILFFWQTSANSLQKPTTLSANSHKSFQQNFHQTFSNFHQKGWKVDFFHQNFHHFHQKAPFSPLFLHQNGEKVDFFHFFFHQLSPELIFLARERELTYLCTVSWDQRGPMAVLVFYSPHSAVLPPAPASWQSNRSITIGREKARRKTKKRTMRISHSQGLTVVRLLHESDFCFHTNHHSSRH